MPFDNLTADPSLDWLGRAIAGEVLARTIGDSRVQVIDGDRVNLGFATHRLQGYLTGSESQLKVHASLWDLATRKPTATSVISGSTSDPSQVFTKVAQMLGAPVREIRPARPESVALFYTALLASDQPAAVANLGKSIESDPGFAAARLGQIQALIAAGDRDGALAALAAAQSASSNYTAEQNARLKLLAARLGGSREVLAHATVELARIHGGDLELWRTGAELAFAQSRFTEAAEALKRAIAIDTANAGLWNLLGYAHAYSGKLDEAVRSLEEYRKLAPESPNPSDSLAEVYFLHGRFSEAARHFAAAFDRDQRVMGGGEAYRAAISHLMAGDRAAAEREFERYIAARKTLGDALIPVRQAIWLFHTGRRQQALTALAGLEGDAGVVVPARVMLALLQIDLGETPAAASSLGQAEKAATGAPPLQNLVRLGQYLLRPLADAELTSSQSTGLNRQVLGYKLLMQRDWNRAAQLWDSVLAATPANRASEERVLAAWAESQRGNFKRVAELMRFHPLPPQGLDPGLSAILFPRSIYLKAVAEKAANTAEAPRLFRLFLDYTSERPSSFGEEAAARRALTQ